MSQGVLGPQNNVCWVTANNLQVDAKASIGMVLKVFLQNLPVIVKSPYRCTSRVAGVHRLCNRRL